MTGNAPTRRLHPLSIVQKSVAAVGQNLIAVGVLYFSVFDRNIVYTALAAFTLIAFIVGIIALIWWRFTYQIGAKEIRIKSGLLRRNNRSIPFDRIQDISLERNLFSRILGLATVKLETGASAGEDGKLDALSLTDARILRDMLRDYKSGVTTTADDRDIPQVKPTDQAPQRPPLFAMDNRRIFIAGLFNFSFILLTILAAIAQHLDFLFPGKFFDPLYWLDRVDEGDVINRFSSTIQIASVAAALVSLVVVGVISGVIRTFIREYGFRLDRTDTGRPGFRRRRGLFTLTDMVMPIHRVQAAIIKTGPVRSHFGWHHLQFQSLASDGSGERDHSVAPCARAEEIGAILAETDINNVTDHVEFLPVHSAMWWRDAIIWAAVLLIVGIANALNNSFAAFALVLLVIPISGVKYLIWRRHQYALTDTQLFVRRGWWRRKLTILPIRKVQTVDISQSPLDHPLDLAALTIGVAGGSSMAPLKISAISLTTAKALRSKLVSPAQKS